MAHTPRTKVCKRFGMNIFGNPKFDKYMQKSQERSGRARMRKKETLYGKLLREKQLTRMMFGISERQFHNYYEKAGRMQGITDTNLLRLLERRADNVIFRAGLAASRPQARQMISHGQFLLNGRRITVPSISVRPGDVFEVRQKLQKSPLFEEVYKPQVNWLKVDGKAKRIEIIETPADDQLEQSINTKAIIEYYSR